MNNLLLAFTVLATFLTAVYAQTTPSTPTRLNEKVDVGGYSQYDK
jgi:hypothetical protein